MNAVFFTAEIKADYYSEAKMERQANTGGHTNYTEDAIRLQRLNTCSLPIKRFGGREGCFMSVEHIVAGSYFPLIFIFRKKNLDFKMQTGNAEMPTHKSSA